jgi:hypothetical protein
MRISCDGTPLKPSGEGIRRNRVDTYDGSSLTAAARNLGYTSPGMGDSCCQPRYDNSTCLVSGPHKAPSSKSKPPTAKMTISVYS